MRFHTASARSGHCLNHRLERNRATSCQTAKQPNSQTSLSCPYCRQLTLKVLGGFEICPVCFWEDDGQKNDDDATVIRGAPNGKHRDSQLCGLRYC
ncbi:MAG: CPCC family cysteine-rich protein [Acidovorax sp.]|uniref:CPCC family cysteine-rich protein n=1 Tax=Acidovorax sp. TaxID=1872122 RepID=UPI00391D4F4B